ncbi:bifunctional FACT complex subunit Spt16 [Babesia duncani]|uniref:FACT complex subunit n=1 Tax=Babesia duncani TaxID=323732 RepID=A0AAD9PNW2_9APIC|nr:bifunctional FACT complex subunit Spt16 [Babesia duncani]
MADAKRCISINFEEITLKLQRLVDLFSQIDDSRLGTIFVCTGKTQEDVNSSPSELLQLWLTGFQFPETLFAFTDDGTWFILTSPKKASYLEPIKEKYEKVQIFHRVPGQSDLESIQQILSYSQNQMVGVLGGNAPVGDFATTCLDAISKRETLDIGFYVTRVMMIRTDIEVELQKKASNLACSVLKSQLINQIENVLDSESAQSHASLVSGAMNSQNDQKFVEKMQKKFGINPNDMEIIYSNVQSGGVYNLGIGVAPTDANLSHEPGGIIVSVCTKYSELCACVTRTLLLNVTSAHKEAYAIANRTFDYALSRLKHGVTFGSVYNDVYLFASKSGHQDSLVRSIGHTIGLEFKDAAYTLSAGNENCIVEDGMVFHLSVGFNQMQTDSGEFTVWITDTVLVNPSGNVVLTSGISKGIENISYELEDEEEEEEEGELKGEEKAKKPGVSSEILEGAASVILQDRLRRRNRGQDDEASKEEAAAAAKRQQELRKQKTQEITERLQQHGGLGGFAKQKKVVKLDRIRSFASPESFEKNLMPNQIFVDMRNEVVMLPINGYHLPFSVLTIKNASCNPDDSNRGHTLRINFQVPGSHTYSSRVDTNPLPEITDENAIFIKEVLYRSSDSKHIQGVFKAIRDLIKQVKQRENDADANIGLAEQEKLQLNKTGRRVVLKDLMVRPNIHGSRRIIGFLEAHHNGLRYLVNTRDRVDNIDISYSNVRHAIFQPCESELIVLIHFNLKFPILVGKRKTSDVQFYCEVGTQVDDLDNRRGRSYNDPDETLEEMRDRELKRRLNSDFKTFVSQLQQLSPLKIEVPYRELMFSGVPSKSNVELIPTANCLVHLVEWPPFVLALDDIEIVSLERIQHGLRNFDMVMIHRDYSKPVKRVDLIPVEYLDVIKQWLNELGIVWYEGKNNLQWTNILNTILEDTASFVENGAFDGFMGDDDEDSVVEDEEDDEYQEEDSEYDEDGDDEDAEEDDDDDGSDYDDESLADEDEEENGEEEEEDEEEGLSWDELEERARRADDRNSFKDERRGHIDKKRKR